jgi:hypothetical protein
MNRRGFLKMMVGGVAAAAAVRTFPFRVFSFPKDIVSVGVNPVSLSMSMTWTELAELLATRSLFIPREQDWRRKYLCDWSSVAYVAQLNSLLSTSLR